MKNKQERKIISFQQLKKICKENKKTCIYPFSWCNLSSKEEDCSVSHCPVWKKLKSVDN